MKNNNPNINCESICFGLNRKTDEQSLYTFLKLITNEELLATMIPRMSDEDISNCVDFFSRLLHQYLSKEEYHALFLHEE